jgi:hypothetical protein
MTDERWTCLSLRRRVTPCRFSRQNELSFLFLPRIIVSVTTLYHNLEKWTKPFSEDRPSALS